MPRGRPPGPPQAAPTVDGLLKSGAERHQVLLALGVGRARVQRRLTRQQLADAAGVNHAVVTGIEAGNRDPSFSSLVRLRRALEVQSWAELLEPDDVF